MRCAACTVSGKKYFTALCLVFPWSWLLPLRFPPQPFKYVHFRGSPSFPLHSVSFSPRPRRSPHLRVWLVHPVFVVLSRLLPSGPCLSSLVSPLTCPPPLGLASPQAEPAPCPRRWRSRRNGLLPLTCLGISPPDTHQWLLLIHRMMRDTASEPLVSRQTPSWSRFILTDTKKQALPSYKENEVCRFKWFPKVTQ